MKILYKILSVTSVLLSILTTSDSTDVQCTANYSERSGTISTSIHSQNNAPCYWRIIADLDEKIFLNITDMDIEKSPDCNSSYIEVRDGLWPQSPLLGRFCGRSELDTVTTTRNGMLISFFFKNSTIERFKANYEAICGDEMVYVFDNFSLKSPNYPERYPLNKKCIWKLNVPPMYQIGLKFEFFDLENQNNCIYDYVEIRDGPSENSKLIGVYCNQIVPKEIVSSTEDLYIKFVSDASVRGGGFLATILYEHDECKNGHHNCAQQCINTVGSYKCACKNGYKLKPDGKNCEALCGRVLKQSSGLITSPSFPNSYPANQFCVWEIVTSPQNRIKVVLNHLDMEEDENEEEFKCSSDKLEISSVFSKNRTKSHGVYCGNQTLDTIVSDSNSLKIVFESTNFTRKTGFSLNFSVVVDKCAINNGNCRYKCAYTSENFGCVCNYAFVSLKDGLDCKRGDCRYEISSSSGILTSPNFPNSYQLGKHCQWLFTTTPGHRINVTFSSFRTYQYQSNCNNSDYIMFFDGASSNSKVIEKFCGYNLPRPIFSTNHELLAEFKSIRNSPTNEYDRQYNPFRFQASYLAVCGGTLLADPLRENYIYSHVEFGLVDYQNETECTWRIEIPHRHQVNIVFTFFELEGMDCNYDYVEISSDTSLQFFGRFCGDTLPPNITSFYPVVIRFQTDDVVSKRGFSLYYKAETSNRFIVENNFDTDYQ